MTVQYCVVMGKKDELRDGPVDAAIVVTVPFDVAIAPGFDATVEYMRGRLKATGHTGQIFELLASGQATAELARIASRSSR